MAEKAKKFKLFDTVFLSICVILVLDTVASNASVGVSSLTWWIIFTILFFIPYGLVTAELGSTYKGEGGIVDWVTKAFGTRVGAWEAWLYWVNYALWIPAVFYLFATILGQVLGVHFGPWATALIVIIMSFVSSFLSTLKVADNKWINNMGTIFKFTVLIALGAIGAYFAMRHGPANSFALKNFVPHLSSGMGFVPVIIFNMLGFEIIATLTDEMPNPQRQVPLATVIGGILILLMYLIGIFGVLAGIPIAKLSTDGGLLDTFSAILGTGPIAETIKVIVGIMFMYTLVTNIVSWAIGVNFVTRYAAQKQGMPAVFKKTSASGAPTGSAYMNAGVSSGVIVIYAAIVSLHLSPDLFWNIFSLGAITLIMSYFPMFLAFLKLRKVDGNTVRPYRIPVGLFGAKLIAWIPACIVIITVIFFFWVPGVPFDTSYFYAVGGGVLIAIIIGAILIERLESRRRKEKN